VRVIIIDDQQLMREGLKMILSQDADIDVVGVAGDGEEGFQLVKTLKADVVIMDMKMPGVDGVEGTKRIMEQFPDMKILVLTTFNDVDYIHSSLKHGAKGYLLKDAEPSEIIHSVKRVYEGKSVIHSDVAKTILDEVKRTNVHDPKVDDLTQREIDICKCLAKGLNNKELGNFLHLSEGTIKNYITTILEKLELRDRTQLAIFSVENGMNK